MAPGGQGQTGEGRTSERGRYTVVDVTGGIVGYARTAREARRLMAGWTCPVTRYRSADLPEEAHRRGAVSGALTDLLRREGVA